ncbi:MAG: hypothetical protein WBC60_00100 [Cognaticolwellia sp.]
MTIQYKQGNSIVTFKHKTIELANEAKNRANASSTVFKQVQVLDKAKARLNDTTEKLLKVDTSCFKLMNLFAAFSLCGLILSSFVTFGEYLGRSFTLSDSTPIWVYIIAITALCSYLFGVKQMISRCLILALLLVMGFSLYNAISEFYIHTSSISRNTYSLPIDKVSFGFNLFMVSLPMVIIAMLKPGYQSNDQLWMKLIQNKCNAK